MPPIKIYTQSAINASKASGVTPQTDAPEVDGSAQASNPTTTTAETSAQQSYPPAQPGAVPSLPVQTATAQSQRYAPVQPTPTVREAASGPPPPQPGAVPTMPRATSTLPPPPKAGEKYHPPEPTQAPLAPRVPYPPQMAIPAPTMPYSAQRGTATATDDRQAQPMGTGYGSGNLSGHPPGYHQNVHASEFNNGQRAAHFSNVSDDRRRRSLSGDDGEEGVWDAAKKLVQAAGEKLSAAETEVWRRINKE